MKRRRFLSLAAKTSLAVAAGSALPRRQNRLLASSRFEGRKIRYVGWQVGLTYQVAEPAGLTRDYLMRLLDEMAANRMNLLSLMMISYGLFDAHHDGYAWPVRNPKLQPYMDQAAANANPQTEYVGEVIQAAADRGIAAQLFMNCGIWNAEKIRQGYPDARQQMTRQEAEQGKTEQWVHCYDSPGGWRAACDEVEDLLGRYPSPNVASYGIERISYASGDYCYCPDTQELFRRDRGHSLLEADPQEFLEWKAEKMTGYLRQYKEHLQRLRPGMELWLHTQGCPEWGHDPQRFAAAGVDVVLPHYCQFPETRESVHRQWEHLAPNPCILHFCSRDRAPKNYKIWIKTPELIREITDWVLDYPGDNIQGLLFFNETATSPRNKQAVYEQIRRFSW